MLVHLEARFLKLEKMFVKDRFDVLLKMPDFRVYFLFTVQPFLTRVL